MKKLFSLKIIQFLIIAVVFLFIGFAAGTHQVQVSWDNYKPVIGISSKNPPPGSQLDMTLFYSVVDKLNEKYYDKSKINPKKMVYGAVSGMVASLDDPYTSFFPPKENTDFKTTMAGEFAGIGAELGVNPENRIIVVAPLDDSPAEKAGIKSGDLIVKVDGKDTFGWTIGKAVENIRGPKGTPVELAVLHDKSKTPVNIKIVRDTIVVKSAIGWLKKLDCSGKDGCKENKDCPTCGSVAYMRLSQFGDKTNNEWITLVNKLYPQIQADKNFKGVILDLRNNPGGYLTDAVYIASEFLGDGVVVIQDDGQGAKIPMNVSRKGLLTDNKIPVLVLINKGSASASEIVSGALRDHKRAKLIGETSFGKGTIQQAEDFEEGKSSVHVTIAKWLTPDGIWVHKKGLTPDIKVEYDASKSANIKDPTMFDNQLDAAIKELLK